jgi:dephospho-CoA kinase
MRIGLTGGAGSGASEAARIVASRGVPVISADEIGHRLLRLADVKEPLLKRFGRRILDKDGEIARRNLGEIVFADKAARLDLNLIVHPLLVDTLKSDCLRVEEEKGIATVDAALIFEWGLQGFFHKIIVIDAPLDIRIRRITQRDGLSQKEAENRLAAQWPLEDKAAAADIVITNDGTPADLKRKLEDRWDAIFTPD